MSVENKINITSNQGQSFMFNGKGIVVTGEVVIKAPKITVVK